MSGRVEKVHYWIVDVGENIGSFDKHGGSGKFEQFGTLGDTVFNIRTRIIGRERTAKVAELDIE